jgi:hypothetical protein
MNMWGAAGQSYEAKSGNRYTADSGGYIANVAANDVLDLEAANCFVAANTLLGRVLGQSLQLVNGTDTAIPLLVPTGCRYNITKIWGIANTNLTAAVGGFYTAVSKGGTAIITSHALSALSASTVFATMGTIVPTAVVLTANPIYFAQDTQQAASGNPAVDIFIFGDILG